VPLNGRRPDFKARFAHITYLLLDLMRALLMLLQATHVPCSFGQAG
jgi:hypothetical protein